MKKKPNLKNQKSKAAAQLLQSSGVLNIKRFQKKMDALREHCIAKGVFEEMKEVELPCPYGVFVSVGNPSARAVVMSGTGETLEAAWDAAAEKMEGYLKNTAFAVRYVKVDLVDAAFWAYLEAVNDLLKHTRKSFFRYGISLDQEFKNAFLEEELNMVRLARYDENGLSLQRINEYLLGQKRQQIFRLPDQVLVFSCQAVFADEDDSVHTLYNDGYAYGRREIEAVDEALLGTVLSTAGSCLERMAEKTGRFQYGYFADIDQPIRTYNTIRHVAAVWALLMKYQREPSEKLLEKIDCTLTYAVREMILEKDGVAYGVDRTSNEIRLGAGAVMVITMITYMELLGGDKYLELVRKLGEGILSCQNEDGDYWHILSCPAAERKEKFRIVYYDGEATFALVKLYGFTKEQKWLDAAEKAIERFIREDYTVHADHWVAYSLNEVTKYAPKEKYFDFALKNVEHNLLRIYTQETSYHTFLEMLMASFVTLQRMKEQFPDSQTLKAFDEKRMVTTIYYRAQHMLAGYFYPEYAMYLKHPAPYIGSFHVRHQSFRMRIDDIEHFMGGYHLMLEQFAALEECRTRLGIAPADYMTLREAPEQEGSYV